MPAPAPLAKPHCAHQKPGCRGPRAPGRHWWPMSQRGCAVSLSIQRERRSLSGKRYLTGRVFARFASDTAHVRAVRTPQHSHESHRDRTRRVIGTQTRVRGTRLARGLSIYSGCGSSSHGRAHPGTRLARVRSPGTPNANRPARRRSASGLRESRKIRASTPAQARTCLGHYRSQHEQDATHQATKHFSV